ncbi:T9SS type A sorting domain-containing protein [Polaribacter sp.]|nr:T9SS type A sorting domain-containing protein [Polaribacter sp.]
MNKNYILTLFMTLCLTIASFGQEMMLNGGLENWTSDTEPTNWLKAEGVTKSTDANTGSFSANQTSITGRINLTQNIPNTVIGESYTISFWYKIAPGAEKPVKMWSNFRDDTGGFIGGTTADVIRTNLAVNGNAWTKYEETVIAPDTSVKFWFELRTFDNTTVYWDDFSFFHNATASLKNNAIVGFAAYPNPVSNGILTISSAGNSLKNITIFNLLGKQVLSSSFSGVQSNVDVSSISAGIYILKVTEAGKTATEKLVIR